MCELNALTLKRTYIRDKRFWLLLLMSAIAVFPTFVPPFLLPFYAEQLQLSNKDGAVVLSVWNLGSGLSRVAMGLGADKAFGPINSLLMSQIIFGLSAMLLWPACKTLGSLLAFGVVNGAGSGALFSLVPVVVSQIYGSDMVANVLSSLITTWGIGYLMVSKACTVVRCQH